ncbi:Putative two-component sensor histidine kinase [uncultured Candidatus Thioglobus sp.]|nr:Putative two-component sensor histidine kinase [uncultured Candidatus Thioglobus sp.]
MKKQNDSRATLSKMDFNKPLLEVLKQLSKNSSITLNVGRASIWRYSDNKEELHCLDLYEQKVNIHTQKGFLSVESCPEYFREMDRILSIDNARTDNRTHEFLEDYLKPLNIHSMLNLPILVNNEVYGVICFEQLNKPRIWREDEIGYGTSITDLIALSVESSQRKSAMDQLISQSRHVVMGEMITTLTHQWKQPLTAMMLGIGTLKSKFKSMSISDKDMQYIEIHVAKIERIMSEQNQLLTDFRGFFHPDKQKHLFNIKTNISSTLDMLEGSIKAQSIQILMDIPNKLEIMGYERDFRHVIINLVQNAIDQITTKEIKNPMIKINAKATEKCIEVAISDNAGGINPSILSTVFKPYVSDKSLNGTGLGLYISKKIIQDQFGGDIFASNTKEGAQLLVKCPPRSIKSKK